jgi:Flp pilus assembly protein CpaB
MTWHTLREWPWRLGIACGVMIGLWAYVRLAPAPQTRAADAARPALSARLRAGHRAVTIPLPRAVAHAPLIGPGDFVDLLSAFDVAEGEGASGVVITLMQRVAVLHRTPSAAGGGATLTLAVTPRDAQRLLFSARYGSVTPVLVPAADTEPRPLPPPATAASVTGLTRLMRRREYHGR